MNAGNSDGTRRNILAAGVGVVTVAATGSPAIGAHLQQREGIRVLDGQSRAGPPLSIMGNPFVASKILPNDSAGGHLLVALDTPPGRGPEMHVHLRQSEWFYVVEGRIGLDCDGVRVVLAKADSFLVPAGAAHAYIVLGNSPAHLLNLFDPGGSMLAFFNEYSVILNRPGPPDVTALKQTYEAHGMKVVGPPLSMASFA